MNIIILSRNKNLYSTSRLYRTAKKWGHDVNVIDYMRCYITIDSKRKDVFFDGKLIEKVDAIIPRIGASNTLYGTSIVRQFELLGTYCLNSASSITKSRDKLRSLQILANSGFNVPLTAFANNSNDFSCFLNQFGQFPVILKLLQSTQGHGVLMAESKQSAESIINCLKLSGVDLMVQRFISESKGEDIRAFVVGNKVVASMKRIATNGSFKSNVHQGGKAVSINMDLAEEKLVLKAVETLGLSLAGVDFMRSNEGPMILEINSSPGLHAIETSSGVDIASKIISFIEMNNKKINN